MREESLIARVKGGESDDRFTESGDRFTESEWAEINSEEEFETFNVDEKGCPSTSANEVNEHFNVPNGGALR